MTFEVEVKDEEGNPKTENRACNFKSLTDFNQKMERKRLSLKRAIQVYAKNKGRSGTEMVVEAGKPNCEQKPAGPEVEQIPYQRLIGGENFLVEFDMLLPIGKKINQIAKMTISFKDSGSGTNENTIGRWMVNNDGVKLSAGQLGPKVTVDLEAKKVILMGVKFTYDTDITANTLEWTKEDCERNVEVFENLKGKESF